jgi:hypothetical protein
MTEQTVADNADAGINAAPPQTVEISDQSLADHLVKSAKIKQADVNRALKLVGADGERLSSVLTKLGIVSERDIRRWRPYRACHWWGPISIRTSPC